MNPSAAPAPALFLPLSPELARARVAYQALDDADKKNLETDGLVGTERDVFILISADENSTEYREAYGRYLSENPRVPSSGLSAFDEGEPAKVKYSTADKWNWIANYFSARSEAKSEAKKRKEKEAYKHLVIGDESDRSRTVFEDLPSKGTVVVIGDVGTADSRQVDVLKAAREVLREHNAELSTVTIIHLGDIYYYGTLAECREFWERVVESELHKCRFYMLPGNHEYVSGSWGFFDLFKKERNTKQELSFFCLRNKDLCLLGLDTARDSESAKSFIMEEKTDRTGQLEASQRLWFGARVEEAKKANLDILLFSHHQYVSPSWKDPHPNENLRSVMAETNVRTWYWGHEHRLLVIEKTGTELKRGVCIGHSAMPETTYPIREKNSIVTFNKRVIPHGQCDKNTGELFFNNGFIVLQINGKSITEHIYEVGWQSGKLVGRPDLQPTEI